MIRSTRPGICMINITPSWARYIFFSLNSWFERNVITFMRRRLPYYSPTSLNFLFWYSVPIWVWGLTGILLLGYKKRPSSCCLTILHLLFFYIFLSSFMSPTRLCGICLDKSNLAKRIYQCQESNLKLLRPPKGMLSKRSKSQPERNVAITPHRATYSVYFTNKVKFIEHLSFVAQLRQSDVTSFLTFPRMLSQ